MIAKTLILTYFFIQLLSIGNAFVLTLISLAYFETGDKSLILVIVTSSFSIINCLCLCILLLERRRHLYTIKIFEIFLLLIDFGLMIYSLQNKSSNDNAITGFILNAVTTCLKIMLIPLVLCCC